MSYGYGETAVFNNGDIVKHGEGSTALSKISSEHAGGYHAKHCLGGGIYVSGSFVRKATHDEINNAKKSDFWVLN